MMWAMADVDGPDLAKHFYSLNPVDVREDEVGWCAVLRDISRGIPKCCTEAAEKEEDFA